MPITIADAPDTLPKGAKNIYVGAFNGAYGGECKDEGERRDECAARIAWKAVKQKYKQVGGKWVAKSAHVQVELYIAKASLQEDGTMRWLCVASDTDPDNRRDRTTLTLFRDWMQRVDNDIQASFLPPPRQPFLGLSHYPSLSGFGEGGITDRMYIDGNQFKAGGVFFDNTLGHALFEAIRDELAAIKRGDLPELPIRISAAWWDIEHAHGDFVFRRSNLDDICPLCVEDTSKTFIKGQLDHYAATRVPINPRTSLGLEVRSMAKVTRHDDAASIVDGKIADELERQTQELLEQRAETDVDPSPALVIKAKDDGEPGEPVEEEPAVEPTVEPVGKGPADGGKEETQPGESDVPGEMVEQQFVDSPEVWRPFGGATSISAAEAWLAAQEKMFQVYDSWGMFRAVMENILDDVDLTDKLPAVRKAIDEFADCVEAIKSAAGNAFLVQSVVATGEEIMPENQVSQVEEGTVEGAVPAVAETPAALDPGAAFWTAIQQLTGNMTLSRGDMLTHAQTALEALAGAVQRQIDTVRPPTPASGEEMRAMVATAVAEAMQPLTDQVSLLLAKSQAVAQPMPATPVQKSQAAPEYRQPQAVQPMVVQTGLEPGKAPSIRAIARRSVGLAPN